MEGPEMFCIVSSQSKVKLANNLLNFISKMPKNSHFRRHLYNGLMDGFDRKDFCSLFNIGKSVYYDSKKIEKNIFLEIKQNPNTTKIRISKERMDKTIDVLNNLVPVRADNNNPHRVLFTSKKLLFEKYCKEMETNYPSIKPLSKKALIYKVLEKEKVHKSLVTFCPICNEESNRDHKELVKFQYDAYKNDKCLVSEGEDSVVVVQDFTQVKYESGFSQDLIICIYRYDVIRGLSSEYHHFVGEIGDKNNIQFVVGVWCYMIKNGFFNKNKKIKIWSDTGPKHFRITSEIILYHIIQSKCGFEIIRNYFAPYHGKCVCDAAAAHIKIAITNNDGFLFTPEQIRNIANGITNSRGHNVLIVEPFENPRTMNEITSYQQFSFNRTEILGTRRSYEENFGKKWIVKNYLRSNDSNNNNSENLSNKKRKQ